MSDSLMMIIGIFIAVILMFIFPLMQFAQRTDELAQTTAHVAVSEFVENVTTKGEITQLDYDRLVSKLSSTGNRFDIQIEAQIIDDNSRRKTTTETEGTELGEYKYYSVYTSTILDAVNGEEGTYKLKKDDYITVKVKNSNKTLATQLKNVFYRLSGKSTYEIGTTVSSVVQHSSLKVEIPDVALAEIPEPTIDEPENNEEEEHEEDEEDEDYVTVTYISDPNEYDFTKIPDDLTMSFRITLVGRLRAIKQYWKEYEGNVDKDLTITTFKVPRGSTYSVTDERPVVSSGAPDSSIKFCDRWLVVQKGNSSQALVLRRFQHNL